MGVVLRRIGGVKLFLMGGCFCRREETYVGQAKQMEGDTSQLLLDSRVSGDVHLRDMPL
jgi:hypothetical protein